MRVVNPVSMSPESMRPQELSGPIRMLVVGADADYRERAVSVLGELGRVAFALVAPTEPKDVWGLVEHEHADVVVLDATDCEAQAAKAITALWGFAPRLGVVVVCEHLTDAARDLNALPKWGWTRDLRAAVLFAHAEGNPLARRRALPGAGRRELRGLAPAPLAAP